VANIKGGLLGADGARVLMWIKDVGEYQGSLLGADGVGLLLVIFLQPCCYLFPYNLG